MEGRTPVEAVERVLDERVRPALRAHGGGVEVLALEGDGTLRVRLLGQCSGCPSARLTTESLIEEEVTAALPEVGRVLLDQPVSDSLLAQARAILNQL